MPKYKEIVVLNSITVNGKEYLKGTHVRDVIITELEAKFNNEHPHLTGCKYEPIDDNKREQLFTEAKGLGLKVPKNIPTDKLKEKIDEIKKVKNDT